MALWNQSVLLLRLSQNEEMVQVLKTLVEACGGMRSLHEIMGPFSRLPIKPAAFLKRAEDILMDMGCVRNADQARKVGFPPELIVVTMTRGWGRLDGGVDDDIAMTEQSLLYLDVTTTDQMEAMRGEFQRPEFVPEGSVCDLFSRARALVFDKNPPSLAEGKSMWNEVPQ
jgi:hypothetical protein